jgi:short-subunit dehydrogenase
VADLVGAATEEVHAMKELRGATALVTGASRGIGVHIAKALAEQGVNVALAARSEADLVATRDVIAKLGVKTLAVPTDVTVASHRHALLERTETELGPIDILVNNAGLEAATAFEAMPEETIERVVAINLTAALLLIREVVPGMLARGRGHVVNIASGAGKLALPFATPYSATKFALVGATQALRAEYRDTPVRFSVICPGFVRGEGMYATHEADGAAAPRVAGRTTPEKVAQAVVKAIVKDRPEILVNSSPVRPLLMLTAAFPSAHGALFHYTGITSWGRRAASSGSVESQLSGKRSATRAPLKKPSA